MLSKLILLFLVMIIVFGSTPNVFAHTAKVVGDFKIEVGWENEPPIVGMDNTIEIIVSLAEESDKLTYEMIFFNKIDDSTKPSTKTHLTGLDDTIDVDIKIGNSKTTLVLEEDAKKLGIYYAKYTPSMTGIPTIHLAGIIKNFEFELTTQIEKVEDNLDAINQLQIPEWVRNNAKWFADGSIDESDFTFGIEYMIKNGIMIIPNLPEHNAKQSEAKVPEWIKNNARWWSGGQIDDDAFVQGIQYLVEKGIIQI